MLPSSPPRCVVHCGMPMLSSGDSLRSRAYHRIVHRSRVEIFLPIPTENWSWRPRQETNASLVADALGMVWESDTQLAGRGIAALDCWSENFLDGDMEWHWSTQSGVAFAVEACIELKGSTPQVRNDQRVVV